MDEQVKARLIGATVLVAIAVLLVPELLSGPKRGASDENAGAKPGTRTVVIDLGGAVASGARISQPEPAPAAAREPARPATIEVPGEGARRDAPADSSPTRRDDLPPSPAATVAASETIAPAPAAPAKRVATSGEKKPVPATSGGWAVQVGAFGSVESARKLVGDLRKDGYSAYVAPLQRGGKTLHRVRVGPAATRADADRLVARMKGRGLPATVVAPD
jgi:DedD protein